MTRPGYRIRIDQDGNGKWLTLIDERKDHEAGVVMQWGSVSEFLSMGGYGLYVWGSYGVTALVLFLEVILVVRRARTPTAITGRKGRQPAGTAQ